MYLDVEEVGTGNLYGAAQSEFTLRPMLRVVEAARSLGVELPSAEALAEFSWDEAGGWGRPIEGARARLLS